jgi:hypothetical protein
MNEQMPPAVTGPVEPTVRPCAWAHRYSPRGLLHTLRDNQQDAEDDAAIVGGSAHAVVLYDERALDEAVAAERERPRQVLAYMATNREGEVRFTDNPNAARELEGYGWAITPLADAGPNARLCRAQQAETD